MSSYKAVRLYQIGEKSYMFTKNTILIGIIASKFNLKLHHFKNGIFIILKQEANTP